MSGSSVLVWGLLFGSVGLGFFVYGKRQQAIVPLLSGIALMVVPYLLSNVYGLVAVGCLLIALPFLVRA
jgi:hypothetical protein